MPSGKQILLSVLAEISQCQQGDESLEEVSEIVQAALLIHGSTAAETWFHVTRSGWLSERDKKRGLVRQGLGLSDRGIFLSDLFEAMTKDASIPKSVADAYPDLTEEEYESATFLMWLVLSACQFFDQLSPVENGGQLDRDATNRMIDNYRSKLESFKADPDGYVGREPPENEPGES